PFWPRGPPPGAGPVGLQPRGVAGQTTQLWLAPPQGKAQSTGKGPTSVTLFDQGLVQVLEAGVAGLEPAKPYVLALSQERSGAGALEPLQVFMTNPAGSAVVNTVGPIRQWARGEGEAERRYLVIAPGSPAQHGAPVQVQTE